MIKYIKKRSKRRSKIRSKRSVKGRSKRSVKRRSKRSVKRKIDGAFDYVGGIQLYNNPSLLSSLPLDFCYKDARTNVLACKYKLTEESNPFILTFPGSEELYKNLEKYNFSNNIYSIDLKDIFALKNLEIKEFIAQLKYGFLPSNTYPQTIKYNYNDKDLNFIKYFIESGEKDLFITTKDEKLILNESLRKKRYDISFLILNNNKKLQADLYPDYEFIKLLIQPDPELELMFETLNKELQFRLNIIKKINKLNKFIDNNQDLIKVIISFFSLFLLIKGSIFIREELDSFQNRYLIDSIDRYSIYIPKLLIYFGADINSNYTGLTPLCQAVKYDNIEMIKFLIKKGAEINKKSLDGYTPLHIILKEIQKYEKAGISPEEKYKIAEYLFKNGADINLVDKDLITLANNSLCNAVKYENIETIKFLIKKGGDKNINEKCSFYGTPLHIILDKILFPKAEDISITEKYKIAEYLLKHGADINLDNHEVTPLCEAVEYENIQMIKFLIKYGADINKTSVGYGTPLNNILQKIEKLRKKGIPTVKQYEIAEYLLENGADTNIENKVIIDFELYILPPLHTALAYKDIEKIKLLIKYGANINKKSYDCTPFNYIVMQILLNKEEGISTTEEYKIAEYLLKNGADINIKYDELTPLFRAVILKNIELIKFLITNGADEKIKDSEGKTARDMNPKIYDKIKKNIDISFDIKKIETISSSFYKKDIEIDDKIISIKKDDKIELPEHLIKSFKEVRIDGQFAIEEIIKFLIETE